ncbi:MAG: transcription factor [Candidatus Woesearchaeota archaeon]|nr:MAG: transcription factor [Candidatus Woesearchaeota archaeon]
MKKSKTKNRTKKEVRKTNKKTELDEKVDKSIKFQKIPNEKKEKIEEVVRELVGEEAIPIVLYLIGKTKVSEFIIANDLNLEIHKARNLMYKLFEQNILTFIRKKDKIKGWYICYWDFNEKSIPFLYEKIKQNKLKRLKERLEKESSSTFYLCKNACTRMDFEKAMEFNFKCPECGELMNEQNNQRTIEFLQQRIKELTS